MQPFFIGTTSSDPASPLAALLRTVGGVLRRPRLASPAEPPAPRTNDHSETTTEPDNRTETTARHSKPSKTKKDDEARGDTADRCTGGGGDSGPGKAKRCGGEEPDPGPDG